MPVWMAAMSVDKKFSYFAHLALDKIKKNTHRCYMVWKGPEEGNVRIDHCKFLEANRCAIQPS